MYFLCDILSQFEINTDCQNYTFDPRNAETFHIDFYQNKITGRPKKKYGIVFLYYPGNKGYLLSPLLNSIFLKKHPFYRECVDMIIVTTSDVDSESNELIRTCMDFHYIIDTEIEHDLIQHQKKLYEDGCTDVQRWNRVFNKLYIFHPEFIGYEKLLLLDCDVFIHNPEMYKTMIECTHTPAGYYENISPIKNLRCDGKKLQFNIPKNHNPTNFRHNDLIPAYMTHKDNDDYCCINAGVLLIHPNMSDYRIILSHVTDVQRLYRDLPVFFDHLVYLPEQEYLTNLFAGRWHTLSSIFDSILNTNVHYCIKYWLNKANFNVLISYINDMKTK